MNTTRRAVVAAATAGALLVAACGGDDDTANTTVVDDTTANTTGVDGTTANTTVDDTTAGTEASGESDGAATTNPATTGGGSIIVGRGGSIVSWIADNCYTAATNQTLPMVYGTLLDWTPDAQGVQPGLAESVVYDADALTYTIALREGLKFSDGSDLTAEDVVFSVEQWKSGPVNGGFFANIETATASEGNVVLQLSAPDTYIEALLSWCVSAVYPEDFGGMTQEEFALAPIGAGPYQLADWKNPGPSEEIVLERNPNYWQEGKPLIDQITYRSNVDPNQRVLAYTSGDVDMLELLELEVAGQIPEDEVVYGANMGIQLLLLNTNRPPLDDLKVRQAIAAAIDRESLTQLYDGHAEVAEGILPNNVPLGGPPTEPFSYDLERAQQLIAESSIPDGASLELLADAGEAPMAQVVAEQLSAIGLDISINIVDNATLFGRAAEGDYDVQINGNIATSPSALDPIVAVQVIDWYFTGMPSETAATEIEQALATEDEDERSNLVTQIQDTLIEEAGMIGLVTIDSVYAVKPSISGFAPFPFLRWYPQDIGLTG